MKQMRTWTYKCNASDIVTVPGFCYGKGYSKSWEIQKANMFHELILKTLFALLSYLK